MTHIFGQSRWDTTSNLSMRWTKQNHIECIHSKETNKVQNQTTLQIRVEYKCVHVYEVNLQFLSWTENRQPQVGSES